MLSIIFYDASRLICRVKFFVIVSFIPPHSLMRWMLFIPIFMPINLFMRKMKFTCLPC